MNRQYIDEVVSNSYMDDIQGLQNPLSYASILKIRDSYMRAGGPSSDEFNIFDTPTTKYFKIFFYFNNGDVEGNGLGESINGGLLAPTWLAPADEIENNGLYNYNSAWSYLKLNDEQERMKLLEDFVNLLSNINRESPWYFDEISGLDAALERKALTDREFKIAEERQKISIKCKPDAYDDRISTLLDLYRAITYSWMMKREVLPSNLRKFDMGIYIFSDPIFPMHMYDTETKEGSSKIHWASFGGNGGPERTSYKYIEFHNCEIDYGSGRTGLSTLKNSEGVAPEYTIDIYFDDCYETRYNEFLDRGFGDMIALDTYVSITSEGSADYEYSENAEDESVKKEHHDIIDGKINFYHNSAPAPTGAVEEPKNLNEEKKDEEKDEKFGQTKAVVKSIKESAKKMVPTKEMLKDAANNLKNEALAMADNYIASKINGLLLGNLFTFSLTGAASKGSSIMKGSISSATSAVKDYASHAKNEAKTRYVNKIGNLFQAATSANNL